jgi:ketosteroid isomerase-like protein
MSQENVEAFKRVTAAGNRGDVEAVLREVHPKVEFHAFMEELLGGEGRVYSGHAGVRDFFRDFNESFDQLHWEYPDIRDLGDRVLAIGTFRARGRASGAEAETPLGVLVDYDTDGVATVVLSTADPRDALEAAGLSE